ncbi:MAG: flagellar biosynthesis protein FliQ [Planctomycetota bacterium]|jgi:flagellar biosynthetic protein FliQ
MDPFDFVIQNAQDALWATLKLSLPLLLVGLVVGLAISVFQAVTQIQDQTLTFVPKIVAMVLTLIFLLPSLLMWAVEYTWQTFEQLQQVWG